IDPGTNGGWVQIMGPVARIAEYKAIETSPATDPCVGGAYFGLEQNRWPPTLIADTPADALSRLFMLPGAVYRDPQFSWKFEVAPAGIGFVKGQALGPQYEGALFMGAARTFLEGGHLFHFKLTDNRRQIAVADPRLTAGVADNVCKFDRTESESLLIGRNFGVGTDIQTGPNGNLFVVSLSNGRIYEIFRRPSHDFNGDARSDILWRNTMTGQAVVWLMNGATVLPTSGSPGSAADPWAIVGQRDFNGDGFAGILWRNATNGQVVVWLLNGATVIGGGSPGSAASPWSVAGTGDFNGDGLGDVLWYNASTGQVVIWFLNGGSVIGGGSPGSAASPWTIAGTGDFNGDGKS